MYRFGLDTSSLYLRGAADENFIESASSFAVEAACQGAPLEHVISRIEDVCHPQSPSYEVIKAASIAWAESIAAWAVDSSCVDPLTDLASAGHLRECLEGLYRRGARDTLNVRDSHRLVVVESHHLYRNQLDCALVAVDIGQALRSLYRRDEIVASLTARRFVALVSTDNLTQDSLTVLAVLLRKKSGTPAPTTRVELLPDTACELSDFLVALSQ